MNDTRVFVQKQQARTVKARVFHVTDKELIRAAHLLRADLYDADGKFLRTTYIENRFYVEPGDYFTSHESDEGETYWQHHHRYSFEEDYEELRP